MATLSKEQLVKIIKDYVKKKTINRDDLRSINETLKKQKSKQIKYRLHKPPIKTPKTKNVKLLRKEFHDYHWLIQKLMEGTSAREYKTKTVNQFKDMLVKNKVYKECPNCGRLFKSKRKTYCCDDCRVKAGSRRYYDKHPEKKGESRRHMRRFRRKYLAEYGVSWDKDRRWDKLE